MGNGGTLGVISTILMLFVIIGISWWAFAPSRRKRFKDDANLPFADDPNDRKQPKDSGDQTSDRDADEGRN